MSLWSVRLFHSIRLNLPSYSSFLCECFTRIFTCAWGCVLHFYIVTIQSLIRKIASAMLTWRTGLPVLCSLRLLRHWLWIVTKPRIQIHPIGTNFISAVPPKFLMWKMKTSWSYLYIHDKTLNSRNEWGNVIPYQIFHSSGMRLAWEFRFCLNLRKLFSRWASLSVRKIDLTVHVHCLYLDMIIPK